MIERNIINTSQMLSQKREENSGFVRKQQRDEIISSKRYFNLTDGKNDPHNITNQCMQFYEKLKLKEYSIDDLNRISIQIAQKDLLCQLDSLVGIRKILSMQNQKNNIQKVIDANLIPVLFDFVQNFKMLIFKIEAIWALANVASGTHEQTKILIDMGFIPLLKDIISMKEESIIMDCIFAIGNIAGDESQFRDIILNENMIQPLLDYLIQTSQHIIGICDLSEDKMYILRDDINANQLTNINNLKYGTWALSNLCRAKPDPEFHLIYPMNKFFMTALSFDLDCEEHQINVTWALLRLFSQNDNQKYVLQMIDQNPFLLKQLYHYLSFKNSSCLPTLKILNKIFKMRHDLLDFITHQEIHLITNQLYNNQPYYRLEALILIQKIFEQIHDYQKRCLNFTDVLIQFSSILQNDAEYARDKVIKIIRSIIDSLEPSFILLLYQKQFMIELIFYMEYQESPENIYRSLYIINRILKVGDLFYTDYGKNIFFEHLLENNGIQVMEKIYQESENNQVFTLVDKILSDYIDYTHE